MRNFLVLILFLSFSAFSISAQSGRIVPPDSTVENITLSKISAEKMYQEASNFARLKFAGFEEKKIPYSETLRLQIVQEQNSLPPNMPRNYQLLTV